MPGNTSEHGERPKMLTTTATTALRVLGIVASLAAVAGCGDGGAGSIAGHERGVAAVSPVMPSGVPAGMDGSVADVELRPVSLTCRVEIAIVTHDVRRGVAQVELRGAVNGRRSVRLRTPDIPPKAGTFVRTYTIEWGDREFRIIGVGHGDNVTVLFGQLQNRLEDAVDMHLASYGRVTR